MKLLSVRDPERVRLELGVVRSIHPELSVVEKERLLMARNGILYLPSHGKYGRIMTQVAKRIGVSRQHVHTTLFPPNPAHLFGTGLSTRLIWTETANVVFSNPLYGCFKQAFTSLLEDREVVIKVSSPLLRFFLKRASELGIEAEVVDQSGVNVATYWVREVQSQ